jgi:hypothetical protein
MGQSSVSLPFPGRYSVNFVIFPLFIALLVLCSCLVVLLCCVVLFSMATQVDRRPNAFLNQFIIEPEEIVLGDILGAGAFGVVHAAHVRASRVACKIPKREFLSKTQHEEFVREVEIMRYARSCRHPPMQCCERCSGCQAVVEQHPFAHD